MPQTERRYFYQAFGLTIKSEIRITPFSPLDEGETDIVVRMGNVPAELPDAVNRGVLYQSVGNEFLLKIKDVAGYYVRGGNEIIIEPYSRVDDDEVSAFLNGTVFGALLHQRKMLPIHASTVIYNGACIMFAGLSGAGKSTVAAALVNKGGCLVADDISVVDYRNGVPVVFPAYPAMKLWKDSLKHLASDSACIKNGSPAEADLNTGKKYDDELLPVRAGLLKYYKPASFFSNDVAEIERIVILGSHNLREFTIKKLTGTEKFTALKKYTYLFRGIPKTNLQENHFVMASRLAALLPVHLLTRPVEWVAMGKMVSEIDKIISDGSAGG